MLAYHAGTPVVRPGIDAGRHRLAADLFPSPTDQIKFELREQFTPTLIHNLVVIRYAKTQLRNALADDGMRQFWDKQEASVINSLRWNRVPLPSEAELAGLVAAYKPRPMTEDETLELIRRTQAALTRHRTKKQL